MLKFSKECQSEQAVHKVDGIDLGFHHHVSVDFRGMHVGMPKELLRLLHPHMDILRLAIWCVHHFAPTQIADIAQRSKFFMGLTSMMPSRTALLKAPLSTA